MERISYRASPRMGTPARRAPLAIEERPFASFVARQKRPPEGVRNQYKIKPFQKKKELKISPGRNP